MQNLIRLALAGAICLSFIVAAAPAKAQAYSEPVTSSELSPSDATPKPVAHKKKSSHKKKKKHSSKYHATQGERTHVRTVQIDLEQLGYNPGPADGIMGPH